MNVELLLHLLALLLVANGAPIVARNWLGKKLGWPIDAGLSAPDGHRILGKTKTWRGLIASVAVTSLLAAALSYSLVAGALFAAYSMVGDMLSSFIKRRAGLAPSSRATGLDQVPEAGLPLLLMHRAFGLDVLTGVVIVCVFMLLEMVLSRLLYALHVRKRPY